MEGLKPIFKYSGGKSSELSKIDNHLPPVYERVVEPFAGGAAVAFHLNTTCWLNDTRTLNTNVFECVANERQYQELQDLVDATKELPTDQLEGLFYRSRDVINGGEATPVELAYAWMVVRQNCFSGMDRTNSSGKFNVPFGWYKTCKIKLERGHHNLLKQSKVTSGDFKSVLKETVATDFVFLDPPYYERESSYGTNFDEQSKELHVDLHSSLLTAKGKWLLIHVNCELYQDLYKDFNITTYDHKYKQNFRGRDNSKQKVQHLYISNY